MCTAITFKANNHYFGRTLDLEYSYNETVTVTPRNYPFSFTNGRKNNHHYAIIGMATVMNNYPLYYEATNEKGLSMAGLNFPDNAKYFPKKENKDNIAPFEFIPWVLTQCKDISEVKKLLNNLNLTDISFSKSLPNSPLHWIIADKAESVTVESTAEALKIYDNSIGVLTNNPPFPYHLLHLSTFMNLSPCPQKNQLSDKIELKSFTRGSGAIGLPGDNSSQSRFVKVSFNKLNAATFETEEENVEQFFHILSSVEQIKGTVKTDEGNDVKTVYTSCCNTDTGIYYYTTYGNRSITGVDMYKSELDSAELVNYQLRKNSIIIE